MQFFDLFCARVASRRRGFTLIELLIVIVIIGILAVGFAPTVLNAPKKARDAVRKGNIASVKQAVEAYAVDNNSKYPVGTGCVDATNTSADIKTSLASYFQGSAFLKDPVTSYKVNGVLCSSGVMYYSDVPATCYILYTQLEVLKSGNLAAAPGACNVVPADNAGDFYATVVKVS